MAAAPPPGTFDDEFSLANYLATLPPDEQQDVLADVEQNDPELAQRANEVLVRNAGAVPGDIFQPPLPDRPGTFPSAPVGDSPERINMSTEQADEREWSLERAVAAGVEAIRAARDIGRPLPEGALDSAVRQSAPEWMSESERRQFVEDAVAKATESYIDERAGTGASAGIDPLTARSMAQSEVSGLVPTPGGIPLWVQDIASQFGALAYTEDGFPALNPEVEQRILDYHFAYTGEQFDSFESYIRAKGTARTAEVEGLLSAALSGVEQTGPMSISLKGVRPATIQLDDQQVGWLKHNYGMSNDGITRLAQLMHVADPYAADGSRVMSGGAHTNMLALAAILRYQDSVAKAAGEQRSVMDTLADQNRHSAQVKSLEAKRDAEIAKMNQLSSGAISRSERDQLVREIRARYDGEIRKLQQPKVQTSKTTGVLGAPTGLLPGLSAMGLLPGLVGRAANAARGAVSQSYGSGLGVAAANNLIEQGLQKFYGIPTLAVLNAVDPNLADRIYLSGADMSKVTYEDASKASRILDAAGLGGRDAQTGQLWPDTFNRSINAWAAQRNAYSGGGGGGGGGGGRVRRLLDQVAVQQQINKLWQSMFRMDAPEGVAEQFGKALQEQLDKSPIGQDFDATARIQAWLEGRSEYREMYGQRPAGMSEDEYQMMHGSAVADILGADQSDIGFDPTAMGMRDGSYQTSVAAAFTGGMRRGSGAGGNSRLQERLARAAEVVARNT